MSNVQIDNPHDISCVGYNTTCGFIQPNSTFPCRQTYLHCGIGPKHVAKHCIHCGKVRGKLHPEYCFGDCHWCEYGPDIITQTDGEASGKKKKKNSGGGGTCVRTTTKCRTKPTT